MPENDDKILNGQGTQVKVPLSEFVRDIAREAGEAAAAKVMNAFLKDRLVTCPMRGEFFKFKLRMIAVISLVVGGLGYGTTELIKFLTGIL